MSPDDKPVKPQLHQSHLAMLYRCGEKFRRVVLDGEREPATTPLVIGTASHASIAINLNNKIEKGTLLTRDAVRDYSRDQFVKAWQETAIMLNDEERADGLQRTKDHAQDTTIELVMVHHYDLAPKIFPVSVERKWVLEAPGFPFDMSGTIDIDELQEIDKEKGIWLPKPIVRIRDTKTRGRNLGQREVDASEQYTFYAMAKTLIDGKEPDWVVQDNIIKPTPTRPAYVISYKSKRTQDDFTVARRRFAQACKVIEQGAFTPACPSDWWCSKQFCGFAADGSCPYFNSKRSTIPFIGETKQGGENGPNEKRTGRDVIAGLESSLGGSGAEVLGKHDASAGGDGGDRGSGSGQG